MTQNRFMLSLAIVSVIGLAISCGGGGGDKPKVDMASIQEDDLAEMTLGLDELGGQFRRLESDRDSGFTDNETAAEDTVDPNDTAEDLAQMGRVSGYAMTYSDPDLAALDAGEGVISLSQELDLFQDGDGASRFFQKQLDDYERLEGEELENGMSLERVEDFPAGDLAADDAAGLRVRASYEDTEFYSTIVAFRLDRLVAATVLYRADDADAGDEMQAISSDFAGRIEEVSQGSAAPESRDEPSGGQPDPGGSGETGDETLVGDWRVYSETLYYDAGGSGGSDSGSSSTRKLVLDDDGTWGFGSSEGKWYVAPVEDADWETWGIEPYGPERKVVLEDWNEGVAGGPVEEDGETVDFFWVIYHVDDPEPGSVWMKFGHP